MSETDINNEEQEQEQVFNTDDFVLYKKGDTLVGGGYKIDSFFLENEISPMTTYNTIDEDNKQFIGGKVSSPFENLAVPAGLFYVNLRMPKHKEEEHFYKKHDPLSDEIFDKLYALVDANKKQQRKTRRHYDKQTNNKTRSNKKN